MLQRKIWPAASFPLSSVDMLKMTPKLNSLCPIFLKDFREGNISQIGTGVLVKIAKKVFLLTAAHVTDERKYGVLMVPGKNGLIPIEGYFSTLEIAKGYTRLDDKIDTAYFKLSDNLANNLHQSLKVLLRKDISLTESLIEGDIYTFGGYPCRKSKRENGSHLTELFSFTGGAAPERKYKLLGYDRRMNVVIKFNRKKTCTPDGERGTAPHPQGISGGGVFAWPKDIKVRSLKDSELNLVAISHSYHEKQQCLAATRINNYLANIYHNNPELISHSTDPMSGSSSIPLFAAMIWYKKEEWPRLISEFDDAEKMHSTWDEWRQNSEEGIEYMARKGRIMYPIEISADEVQDYCKLHNCKNTSQSRVEIASSKLAAMIFEEKIE